MIMTVPGLGGNQLDAKLNKPSVPHIFCFKNSDYYRIWVNAIQFLPIVSTCWVKKSQIIALYLILLLLLISQFIKVDNMKLKYNKSARKTENSPGVKIRTPEFGKTDRLEWLDDNFPKKSFYFKFVVEALVNRGYKRGETVLGAPYDFRKGPSESFISFLNRIHKKLILIFRRKYRMVYTTEAVN